MKHRLKIKHSGETEVFLKCENCPKYLKIERATLYDLLVNDNRSLANPRDGETVRRWSQCGTRFESIPEDSFFIDRGPLIPRQRRALNGS